MKYKAKDNYVLREVAGDHILFARGAGTLDCNFLMVFNETGALIYKAMEQPVGIDELADLLVKSYGIEKEEALRDTEEYINKMLENDIAEAVQG